MNLYVWEVRGQVVVALAEDLKHARKLVLAEYRHFLKDDYKDAKPQIERLLCESNLTVHMDAEFPAVHVGQVALEYPQ